jgi:glycosyltransferase involved in cell wall biosynthesis
MKICFYCNSLYSYGGVQRVLSVLASKLAENHKVSILTLDPPVDKLIDNNIYDIHESIEVEHLKYNKLPFKEFLPSKLYALLYKTVLPHNRATTEYYGRTSFPESQRQLLINHINKHKHDVVIGVHVFLSFHLASISKDIKATTIGWMHNSYEAFFYGKNAYIKNQEKRFKHQMKSLDKIIVLSDSDKKKFRDKLGIETERIYNPLTIDSDSSGEYASKKFIAVGRYVPQKGFDILIKAFAKFALKDTEWSLDIIGDGPEKKRLEKLIDNNSLTGRVTLHPFTKHIESFYRRSSIFVLSSRWEGFGLVLFEAMQHRLPLIAPNIPVVNELLSGKKFAVIFENKNHEELADKMKLISNSPDLAELGNQAYEYSTRFKVTEVSKQWETLLNSLTHEQ